MGKSIAEIHERISKLTMLAADTSTTEAEREAARRKLATALDELRAVAEPPTVGVGDRFQALGVNVEAIMQNIGAYVAPIFAERATQYAQHQAANIINAGFDRIEDYMTTKTTKTTKTPPKRNGAKTPPKTPKPKPVERMTRAALIEAIETAHVEVDIPDADGNDVESVMIALVMPLDVLDALLSDRPDAVKVAAGLGNLVLDTMAEGPHGADLLGMDDDEDSDGGDEEDEDGGDS